MPTWVGMIALLMWSSSALLGTVTSAVPAYLLLFCCFVICSGLMLSSRIKAGKPLLRNPGLSVTQWIAGIIGMFGSFLCFFLALKLAPPIEASLINYLWPLLLSMMIAKKGKRARATLGGLLGFSGIYLLVGDSFNFTLSSDVLLGYLLALISAFFWAGYSWFLSVSPGSSEDVGWISIACAVLSLVAHWQLGDTYSLLWDFSSIEWLGVILLGLGPVGGAFFLWDHGLKKGNTQFLASISFFIPLVSSVLLAIFGISDWSVNITMAIALILAGAAVVNEKSPPASNDDIALVSDQISMQS